MTVGVKNKVPKKKTHDQFISEVNVKYADEYKILDEYKNNKEKVSILHNKCGNVFSIRPNDFLMNYKNNKISCVHCRPERQFINNKITTKTFKKIVFDLEGDNYDVISECKGAKDKVTLLHKECNLTHEYTYNHFVYSGRRCPYCSGRYATPERNLETDFHELIKEWDYTKNKEIPSNISPKSSKIVWWRCKDCSHEWKTSVWHRTGQDKGCPKCNLSKGVKLISKVLDNFNITYELEKKFEKCRRKAVLPFDIYLKESNILIEYDGEGHFLPFRFSKNKKKMKDCLMNVQKRDQIKNKYCIDENISLIRIPFWEYNDIESILKDILGFLI